MADVFVTNKDTDAAPADSPEEIDEKPTAMSVPAWTYDVSLYVLSKDLKHKLSDLIDLQFHNYDAMKVRMIKIVNEACSDSYGFGPPTIEEMSPDEEEYVNGRGVGMPVEDDTIEDVSDALDTLTQQMSQVMGRLDALEEATP